MYIAVYSKVLDYVDMVKVFLTIKCTIYSSMFLQLCKCQFLVEWLNRGYLGNQHKFSLQLPGTNIIDGNSEHVAHSWWKTGLFG